MQIVLTFGECLHKAGNRAFANPIFALDIDGHRLPALNLADAALHDVLNLFVPPDKKINRHWLTGVERALTFLCQCHRRHLHLLILDVA